MGNPAHIVALLDAEARHCHRVTMKAVRGLEFLLDLPQAAHLRGGDALVLEDGSLVEVLAAPKSWRRFPARTSARRAARSARCCGGSPCGFSAEALIARSEAPTLARNPASP